MKVIDKTPFRSETGEISFIDRIQATLKYGAAWVTNVQAQDKIVPMLEKHLGRGYTLLRNITLPGTDISLPMILVGPAGIFLINVMSERGIFQAKEEEWGIIDRDHFTPAKVNMIKRTLNMARVLQVFLDRQGFKNMITVDSALLAADPGTHVETVRPAVRVVMSDAIERFAASLNQARGALSLEAAANIADMIVTGRQGPTTDTQEQAQEPNDLFAFHEAPTQSPEMADFRFEEASQPQSESTPAAQAAEPMRQRRSAASKNSFPLPKFSRTQWIVLSVEATIAICALMAIIIFAVLNAR